MRRFAEHRRRNLAHSVLLIGGMALLAAACAYVLAGASGVVWALATVVAVMVLSPAVPPGFVLAMYRARPLRPREFPTGYTILRELAARAGLPTVPTLYYVPSAMLNAFALGRPEHAAIAVTDGMLRRLSLRELTGVLAHEASHIAHHDLWLMNLADVMSRATTLLSYLGMFLLLLNLPMVLMGGATTPLPVVLLLVFAPTLMSLLQLALSRAREFDADLGAARLTGDPQGLIAALVKLERTRGRFWQGLVLPGQRVPQPSLLRTHPPTEQRVQRLLDLTEQRPQRLDTLVPAAPRIVLPRGFVPVERPPRWRWLGVWY